MYNYLILFILLHRKLPVLCSAHPVPDVELLDGTRMPMIGLGTLYITEESTIKNVIEDGLKIGYRYIDTAYFYNTEVFIGQKLREIFRRGGKHRLKREDIYVTSKLWCTYHSREKVVEGLHLTLKKLNIKYLDLFLIHFPFAFEEGGKDIPLTPEGITRDANISVVETWKGMEDAYRLGLVNSIGVSNFNVEQICRLMRETQIKPLVNQIELNPYLTEEELVYYCQQLGIQVQAYSPFSKANQTLLNEPVLKEIGHKFNKTVAQVILRWIIQRNIVAIPGTSKKARLIENFDVFDFKLSGDEMKAISALNVNFRKTDLSVARYNSEYSYSSMGFSSKTNNCLVNIPVIP